MSVNGTAKVPGSNVNVRSSYSTSSSSLGQVTNVSGTVKQIQYTSDHYTWYKIQFSNLFGWVRGDLVKPGSGGSTSIYVTSFTATPKAAGYPVYDAMSTNTIMGYTQSVSYTAQQVSGLGWLKLGSYYIQAILMKVDPSTTSCPTASTKAKVYLRETPTSSDTSNYVNASNTVAVLDTTSVSGWYRIGTNVGIGWVSASQINL
jgi:uncharacterized protein YgiM (DUF1202 family)